MKARTPRLFFACIFISILVGSLSACQMNISVQPTTQTILESTNTPEAGQVTTGYIFHAEPSVSATPAMDTLQPMATSEFIPSVTSTLTPVVTLGPTRYVTRTRTPTRTRWPTRTPTITLTPLPPVVPIAIGVPGPLSKVSSPLHMEAGVMVGDDGMVYLELKSETGVVFESQTYDYRSQRGKVVYFYENIDFTITAAAETARLTVSTRDQHDRLMALNSVDVILMQLGEDEINPQAITRDPYIVRSPSANQPVSGGLLVVTGVADPVNTSPVMFDLFTANGAVIASGSLQIAEPTGDLSHTPYRIEIPYSVTTSTQVRLTIYQQSDNRLPGIVALSSVLITLNP